MTPPQRVLSKSSASTLRLGTMRGRKLRAMKNANPSCPCALRGWRARKSSEYLLWKTTGKRIQDLGQHLLQPPDDNPGIERARRTCGGRSHDLPFDVVEWSQLHLRLTRYTV